MNIPWLTFLLSGLIISIYTFFGATPEALIFVSGHMSTTPWTLITAHFAHTDVYHLIWNLLPFIVLGSLLEYKSRRTMILSILLGIVSVNIYLLFVYDRHAYTGLSGVLNTILITYCFILAKSPQHRYVSLSVILASFAKCVYETTHNQSIFTELVWPSVPEAHLAGMLGGIVLVLSLNLNRIIGIRQANYSNLHSTTS